MFELEKAFSNWREQILAAGIKSPVPLEELESHLRDEIERQMNLGASSQSAYEMAVKTIGHGDELKKEFKKAGEPLAVPLVKLMSIGCWTVSFMLSLWCLQFLFYQTELAPIILGLIAVATSVLCWRYGCKFLPAIHHESIRAIIGFACCVGGVVWIQLFIIEFLPGLAVHSAGKDVAEGRLLAVVLWACTAMAILSSIGYGLEKAAHERGTANS
jgi:hypothetical protein